MATQGPSDPLDLMRPAQGKIIEGLEELANIATGVA
jgi:hypothetical protein